MGLTTSAPDGKKQGVKMSRKAFPSLSRFGLPAIVLVLIALAPVYVSSPYILGVLNEALILSIWAISIGILIDLGGLVTLGHAALLSTSVYLEIIAETRFQWSFAASSSFAVLGTLVVAVFFGILAMRARAIYFIMITIAQGMVVWGLAISWTTVTGGDNGVRADPLGGVLGNKSAYFLMCVGALLAAILAVGWFKKSRTALLIRGTRESPVRMTSLGYSVPMIRLTVFVVAGGLAAVSGILYSGLFRFISHSSAGLDKSIEGLVMVLIGGPGSIYGPVLGAFILVILKQTVLSFTSLWHLLFGALLIAIIILRLRGIVTLVQERINRRADAHSEDLQLDAAKTPKG
jgi:branched-chain amino acid transport system permease protein